VGQVVPFTPASGLLEWVENTMPLSEYLIGADRTSGAHQRYARPDDYTFAECHHLMHKPPGGDLRAAWDDVWPPQPFQTSTPPTPNPQPSAPWACYQTLL
jgi:hypothetical protein